MSRSTRSEARRRGRRTSPVPRCVLDSGGLSALTGRSQRARAWFRWILEQDGQIVVPVVVLAETVTGDAGRDAETNRVLGALVDAGSVLVGTSEPTARRAGEMRYRATSDDGIDALVAATAEGDGAPTVLLTSDPDDLERLLAGSRNVAVRAV